MPETLTSGSIFFPDFPSYWEQIWNPEAVPPGSESLQYLRAGRWDQNMQTVLFDERVMSLHLPDIRICYGVYQGEEMFFDEVDDRTQQVTDGLASAFEKRFDPNRIWVFPGNQNWAPPIPMNRDWELAVEKIEYDGRVGYYFAVDCPPLLQDVAPDAFRYREPELMEALGETINELDLAPVILWQRFGDPMNVPSMAGAAHPMNPTFYLIELWEKK